MQAASEQECHGPGDRRHVLRPAAGGLLAPRQPGRAAGRGWRLLPPDAGRSRCVSLTEADSLADTSQTVFATFVSQNTRTQNEVTTARSHALDSATLSRFMRQRIAKGVSICLTVHDAWVLSLSLPCHRTACVPSRVLPTGVAAISTLTAASWLLCRYLLRVSAASAATVSQATRMTPRAVPPVPSILSLRTGYPECECMRSNAATCSSGCRRWDVKVQLALCRNLFLKWVASRGRQALPATAAADAAPPKRSSEVRNQSLHDSAQAGDTAQDSCNGVMQGVSLLLVSLKRCSHCGWCA